MLESREPVTVLGVTCHAYWILDKQGRVLAAFGPEFGSDCEYGLPVEYARKDGTLLRFSGRTNDMRVDALTRWTAEVVCVAGRELPPGSPEARRIREVVTSS